MTLDSRHDPRCPLCGSSTMEIPQGTLVCEDLVISGITVSRAGRRIKLTSNEFWLLVYLVHNKNRVVTRRMIEEHGYLSQLIHRMTGAAAIVTSDFYKVIGEGG
jgi:DNA-binding response OmpR family regulator